ncbi:MAG TPA: ATP-binding protein, partial [Bacteroidales bacterium]|nr:ATP-binding protein [Bacteroidales bacterium]
MIIDRTLKKAIKESLDKFPIVSITGPRQSGKTTLLRNLFPDFEYYNLERLDHFDLIISDPIGVLKYRGKGIIVDEAQKYPDLFSTIQVLSDEQNINGQYILSGSQSFIMNEKIAQSLAGRVRVHHLLPFDVTEIEGVFERDFMSSIFQGFYPRVLANEIHPGDFYPSYIQTYLEKDIRTLGSVENLRTFTRFLTLCAGRSGQILNLNSLANDTGVSVNTVKRWISLLESSFIIFLLEPYHKNFNKRIIKSPKLYFYDTGLICSLLRIDEMKSLRQHYHFGSLFENLLISELKKQFFHSGRTPHLYYWRDSNGVEIDCIIEKSPEEIISFEIKAGETFTKDYLKNIERFDKLSTSTLKNEKYIVYNGDDEQTINNTKLMPWNVFQQK